MLPVPFAFRWEHDYPIRIHSHGRSFQVRRGNGQRALGCLKRQPCRTLESKRTSKWARPPMPRLRALVASGVHTELPKSVADSTMTERLVAQETVKPNWLDRMPRLLFRIRGSGSDHNAVGIPKKVEPQPVVPVK